MELFWRAVYYDKVIEFQEKNRYEDIDRERLDCFDLIRKDNGFLVFRLKVDDSIRNRWFWRRRTLMRETGQTKIIHLIGWKKEADCMIAFVFEDGWVFVTSKWDNPCPLDPPILRDFEKG